MEYNRWFSAVGRGNSNFQMAVPIGGFAQNNATIAVNDNRFVPTSPVNTSPVVTGRPVGPVNTSPVNTSPVQTGRPVSNDPSTVTIACNQCNGGFPIGNLFPGNSCPSGWTSDIDPCNTRLSPVDPVPVGPVGPVIDPTLQPADPILYPADPILYPADPILQPVQPPFISGLDPSLFPPTPGDLLRPGCTDPNSITYNPMANYDNGTCEYMEEPMVDPNIGITPEGGIYENICYSCSDGKVEATVIPSEVQSMCPEGFSQDSEGVCPKEEVKEEKDNKNLILYLAIGIGAYMLLSNK